LSQSASAARSLGAMTSEVIARVRSFFSKARELGDKGHLLRAAEYYSRAAEAARALDSGPDNLVVVCMQQTQAHALHCYVANVDDATADACVVAAHRAKCVVLLSAAVAALERRRVAGTLLEGNCTAVEEAWYAAEWREASHSPAEAASQAKLVGYDSFLRAAHHSICLLDYALYYEGECSAPQFQAFTQHVVHATHLMQQPRSHGTISLISEAAFGQRFSAAMANDDSGVLHLTSRGLDAVQLLTAAWQRLQRSGVLEARGLLSESTRLKLSTQREKSVAAIRAAVSAPGLRTCALAGCGAKEAHPQHFKSCAACRTVVYCCREHQVEGWPSHKKACKAACKAAAAASADGGGAGPGAAS